MEQEKSRNPDGTFKEGHSGNPNGRPVNTLKAFLAREFREMDDDAKREWIKENKISAELIWKMAEGNPSNDMDVTSDGEKIAPLLVKIIGKDEQDNGDTN